MSCRKTARAKQGFSTRSALRNHRLEPLLLLVSPGRPPNAAIVICRNILTYRLREAADPYRLLLGVTKRYEGKKRCSQGVAEDQVLGYTALAAGIVGASRCWADLMTTYSNAYTLLRRFIPGMSAKAIFRRFRILIYSAIYPRTAWFWFLALSRQSLLTDLAVHNRRFAEKPFHRFGQADMAARSRAGLICAHYAAMEQMLGGALTSRIYLRGETVSLSSTQSYEIVLREPTRCWREGLLTVAWMDRLTGVDLAWATISIERSAQTRAWVLLIGGLQGPRGTDRECVREATKACHGLRPKAAVMEALCELCRLLNIPVLAAVAKSSHVSHARDNGFHADYDTFWRELGGVESGDRFILPRVLHHREIDQVPSNRRAAFRRKQALIAEVLAQIQTTLGPELSARGRVKEPAPYGQHADHLSTGELRDGHQPGRQEPIAPGFCGDLI